MNKIATLNQQEMSAVSGGGACTVMTIGTLTLGALITSYYIAKHPDQTKEVVKKAYNDYAVPAYNTAAEYAVPAYNKAAEYTKCVWDTKGGFKQCWSK
jgi:hypothetical protein